MRIKCACGFSGHVPDNFSGKQVRCRKCGVMIALAAQGAAMSVGEPIIDLANVPIEIVNSPAVPPTIAPQEPVRIATATPTPAGSGLAAVLITVALVSAVLGAGLVGLIGLFVSQYAPMFGNIFLWKAEPWSEAKDGLILVHVLTFGLAGVVLGALVGPAVGYVFHYVFRSL